MNGYPAEDSLPKEAAALVELIRAARADKLSFRYVNVLRHRLMDAVMGKIERGDYDERDLRR